MRLIGAYRIDHRPERARISGALRPARKEGASVRMGEALAHIETDQRVGGGLVADPVKHLRAAPDVAFASALRLDQGWRGLVHPDLRDGDALVVLALGARPVDTDIMGETPLHPSCRSLRFFAHQSSRLRTSRSKPRSTGR